MYLVWLCPFLMYSEGVILEECEDTVGAKVCINSKV